MFSSNRGIWPQLGNVASYALSDRSSSASSSNHNFGSSLRSVNASLYSSDEDTVATFSKTETRSSEFVATDKLWPSNKTELYVDFMNGTPQQRSLVERLVTEHYNSLNMRIKFKFPPPGEVFYSDIRLEFGNESWSYLGTDARSHLGRTTMRVYVHSKCLKGETCCARSQANILHEFGHALGMVHAHKHPNYKANWNYQNLMSKHGWTLKKVRRNYDNDTKSVDGKEWDLPYDPRSIMHYPVGKGDTHNYMSEVGLNSVLSYGDQMMLLRRYPKRGE